MSVFECLAKAENNSITKLVDNIIDQTPSNLLTFVHLIRVRDNLSRIKNSLESIKDIEAYTDGSFKKYTIISVDIGNTFLISSPKKLEFNVNITDNPSAFKISRGKLLLVKVKAHNNCEYNNVVDKLAKNALSKDLIFIDPRLLMYRGNLYWNNNPIEKENNSETLAEIEWSSTFRVLKGNTELTNFIEHELNLFKVKIWTEELPTLDNLIKRKPYVYNSKWKCPMCFKDKKTYSHLWKCEHLEQVYLNMIDKFQQYLQELILVNTDLEHQKGINAKMKKSANKSKLVVNKLDKIVSSHWEL
ncbi:hypothetical protein RhiirA4_466959 [Rhizophagus irregularis]|uniref:Uncharacterized protein n=1 Tax=Rhizophagus irregularis TaxID=588596 RepID=A0A2I1GV49_9GLOM|nr:hypothetical protein RhiirA4_466959 [Rhizophagus irregularis]